MDYGRYNAGRGPRTVMSRIGVVTHQDGAGRYVVSRDAAATIAPAAGDAVVFGTTGVLGIVESVAGRNHQGAPTYLMNCYIPTLRLPLLVGSDVRSPTA